MMPVMKGKKMKQTIKGLLQELFETGLEFYKKDTNPKFAAQCLVQDTINWIGKSNPHKRSLIVGEIEYLKQRISDREFKERLRIITLMQHTARRSR